MNCLESHALLQRYLDGEPVAAGRDDWAVHLILCPECRDEFAAAQCLLDGLYVLPPTRPPAGLIERIYRQVVVDRRRAARLRRLLVPCAMAASFLLACWTVYFGSSSRMDPQPGPARAEQAHPATASFSLHRSIEEAGLAVAALTRRAADETVGQTTLLLPARITQAAVGNAPELEQALERPAQSLWEIQQGVSAGIEPVLASARRAVGFFLREIPAVENIMQ